MNLLALEAATEACSVALDTADGVVHRHRVAPRRHTALLLDMVDEVLGEAGLARSAIDAVAFGHGPGSFTGVRIAAALAQGLALAHELPVATVSTLHALAAGAAGEAQPARVAVALDARRSEIYFATYAFTADTPLGRAEVGDCVMAPAEVTLPGDAWRYAGNGWRVYGDHLLQGQVPAPQASVEFPHARDVARLARAAVAAGAVCDSAQALPVYLRGALD